VTDLKVVGTITRSHGLDGSLKVNVQITGFPALERDEPVFILLQGGPVPFFVEECNQVSSGKLVLKLEDVDSLEQAEKLVGNEVLLERAKLDAPEHDASNELIGCKVVDSKKGEIGSVSGIMDNPQHPILEIEFNGKTILVPWVEEIITAVDIGGRIISISAPDGLIDLYING
jgi:16S rRNA processing protein RimM